MPPLRRLPLNLLTLLSLLLCAALAALWARSYWREDGLAWERRTHEHSVVSLWGLLRFDYGMEVVPLPGSPGRSGFARTSMPAHPDSGASIWGETRHPTSTCVWGLGLNAHSPPQTLYVPHWVLVATTAALPVARLARAWTARRRRRAGRCPSCNYDLTANTSGVCPECGKALTARNSKGE